MFIQTLNNACDIPLSQFSSLNSKEILFMSTSQKKNVYRLKVCKNQLHGKIVFAKRDKPLTHLNVCRKLDLA